MTNKPLPGTDALHVVAVEHDNARDVRDFCEVEVRLHSGSSQWVPPLWAERKLLLDRQRHPYYQHSDAEFFIARRGQRVVGRVAVMEPRRFNRYRGSTQANFGYLEIDDDDDVADILIGVAIEWARQRNLTELVGPRGLGPLDGHGLLVEGFDYPQMMTMSCHHHPYYAMQLQRLGFEAYVDYASYSMESDMTLDETYRQAAQRLRRRGLLRVARPTTRRQLRDLAPAIGRAYNRSFADNWEFYPLTDAELDHVTDVLTAVADPPLTQLLVNGDEIVGFLLSFPDISDGLRRAKGKLWPLGALHIHRSLSQTDTLALNGIGVLPRWRNRGAQALLFEGLHDSLRGSQYRYLEVTQVASTAVRMRSDMRRLGARQHKNHRVFGKRL